MTPSAQPSGDLRTEEHPLFSALDERWSKEERLRFRPLLIEALEAAAVLSRVDERVFAFTGGQEDTPEISKTREEVATLSEEVLSPVRKLQLRLAEAGRLTKDDGSAVSEDVEFDFSEPVAQSSERESFNSQDIFGAVDALRIEAEPSSADRAAVVEREIAAFAYGLGQQLEIYDQRLATTTEEDRSARALQELEDAVETFVEGLFALVAAISKPYLETFDRAKLLPGHRTGLENALMARAGLTDLRRVVTKHNSRIQGSTQDPAERARALGALLAALDDFMHSEVFSALRAAERSQLTTLAQSLTSAARSPSSSQPFATDADSPDVAQMPAGHRDPAKTMESARTQAEGLSKYLDSLAMVAVRDSVVQHDREVLKSIAELLEAAHSLVGVSTANAQKLAKDALARLPRLYGMRDGLDALIIEWRESLPALDEPDALAKVIDQLYEVEPRLLAGQWFGETSGAFGSS